MLLYGKNYQEFIDLLIKAKLDLSEDNYLMFLEDIMSHCQSELEENGY